MKWFIIIIWLYLGMYGYIFWVAKHNKRYRAKWRTADVSMIPIFGLFGPMMFIIGFVLYKQRLKQ